MPQETIFYKYLVKKDLCCFCHKKYLTTLEHIHPRSSGGTNVWTNFSAACVSCNNLKGSKTLLEFLISGSKWPTIVPKAVLDLGMLAKMPKDWQYPIFALAGIEPPNKRIYKPLPYLLDQRQRSVI